MALAQCSNCRQWANQSTGEFTPASGRRKATFLCADCVRQRRAAPSPASPSPPPPNQLPQPPTETSPRDPVQPGSTPTASTGAGTSTTTSQTTGWFRTLSPTVKVAGLILLAFGVAFAIWTATKDDERTVATACRLTAGGVTTLAGLARTEQAGLAVLATYGISEACEPLLKSLIDKPEEDVRFTLDSGAQTQEVTVPGLDITNLLPGGTLSLCDGYTIPLLRDACLNGTLGPPAG